MQTATTGLCADRETLDNASVRFQFHDQSPSGHIASVNLGNIAILSFGDCDAAYLATSLERLAGEVRRLATEAISKRWEELHPVLAPDESPESARADLHDDGYDAEAVA